MDLETGESLRDKETGEMPASARVNTETGESEINRKTPKQNNNTKKFRIPNPNPPPPPKTNNSEMKNPFPNNNIASCMLFLLPTTLFFYPPLALCMLTAEIILHIWAHKQNKRTTKKDVCYRSPLHIILREFCAACKEERSKNKIINMQDKRSYKFLKYGIDYVHGITT